VVADLPRQIEGKVHEVIDWLIGAELRQWQAVTARLDERRQQHAERIVGRVGTFDQDRRRLLDTVGRAAQRALEGFDREAEARRLAEEVQTAITRTAIVEVGAIGLGAILTAIATSHLADFTGILAAGSIAVLGLYILPARRKKAQRQLEEKVLQLRRELMDTLTAQFDREVQTSVHRIEEAISPYSRFVRAERERLGELQRELARLQAGLGTLQERIERL